MKVSKLSKIALAVALAVPAIASAESNFVTGATPLTATARLNFQITIPRILFLQVGSGSFPTDDGTTDTVTWSLTPAQAITPGAVAPTSGTVAVRVTGNGGNVTLNSNTPGPLLNASGDQIAYTTITATSSNPALGHPAFAASGLGTAVNLAATGRIYNQTANWTFSYANAALVPEGTYGGTVPNQGQVTYTATLP